MTLINLKWEKKSIKLYKAIKTKFNSTLFSLNKKINKFNVRFKSFFSVCFDNYYKILFIMIRLEMYKSNLKLNKEGGDVFFFPPDVHTLWRPKVNNTCLRNIFKNEKRMFVFRIRHIHWIIQGHCAMYPGPFKQTKNILQGATPFFTLWNKIVKIQT